MEAAVAVGHAAEAAQRAEAEYIALEGIYQRKQQEAKNRSTAHKQKPEPLKTPPAARGPDNPKTPPASPLPLTNSTLERRSDTSPYPTSRAWIHTIRLGAAIALPTGFHQQTRTYGARGIVTAAGDAGLPLQEVLNKDYADLRSLDLPFGLSPRLHRYSNITRQTSRIS